jgi:hypothetical protein
MRELLRRGINHFCPVQLGATVSPIGSKVKHSVHFAAPWLGCGGRRGVGGWRWSWGRLGCRAGIRRSGRSWRRSPTCSTPMPTPSGCSVTASSVFEGLQAPIGAALRLLADESIVSQRRERCSDVRSHRLRRRLRPLLPGAEACNGATGRSVSSLSRRQVPDRGSGRCVVQLALSMIDVTGNQTVEGGAGAPVGAKRRTGWVSSRRDDGKPTQFGGAIRRRCRIGPGDRPEGTT